MPLNQDQVRQFERAVSLARTGSGLRKMLARPLRMGYSKVLERWCRARGCVATRTATTFWGDPMQVIFPDRVSMTIYRYGFFEEEETRVLLDYLKPGMTFFDVGSHFGFFSLLASTIVGPPGQVVAFEPTPSTFEMVRKNLAGRANCRCENIAAFRENTELEFHDFGVEYSGYNSLYGGKIRDWELARATKRNIRVKAQTLDSWCRENNVYPDLLKVDTEGAELDVLAGMDELLRTRRPMLTLEMGDIAGAQDRRPSRAVVDAILSKGYRGLEYREGKFEPHVPVDHYEYTNLLFVPA